MLRFLGVGWAVVCLPIAAVWAVGTECQNALITKPPPLAIELTTTNEEQAPVFLRVLSPEKEREITTTAFARVWAHLQYARANGTMAEFLKKHGMKSERAALMALGKKEKKRLMELNGFVSSGE